MQELIFTRDWRKNDTAARGGFPTDVYDEETVRADMQALHEETRAYINGTLKTAVEEVEKRLTVSFGHVPVIGENGTWQLWSEEEERYVDSGISAWQGDMDEALSTTAKKAAEAVTPEGIGAAGKDDDLVLSKAEGLVTVGGRAVSVGNAHIGTGSYVGTGDTKINVELEFDFAPQLVCILGSGCIAFLMPGVGFVNTTGGYGEESVLGVTFDGGKVSFQGYISNNYGNSYNLNAAETTYRYVALGGGA